MKALQAGARAARSATRFLLLAAVQAYRLLLSPLLGPSCRYEPSCSAYALEAIANHGPWRGTWLALRRVLRCHPLRPGGYDPVPREASGGP
jgi:hypothetical protein